jgi:hypothetical protein
MSPLSPPFTFVTWFECQYTAARLSSSVLVAVGVARYTADSCQVLIVLTLSGELMKSIRCSLLLPFVAIAFTFGPSSHAQVVLDQSVVVPRRHATGVTHPDSFPAQTFTVGVHGKLARIDVAFGGSSTIADLTIRLLGTTAGVPDPQKELATFVLQGEGLTDAGGWETPRLPLDFSAFNVHIQEGDRLAIALEPTPPDVTIRPDSFAWWDSTTNYGRGAAYSGDRRFGAYFRTIGTELDRGFATYVTIPEPPGGVLVAVALVVVAATPRVRAS